jgi:hypothetical protein
MKRIVTFVSSLGLVAVLALLLNISGSKAAEPDRAVQKSFKNLVAAVQSADRDAFVAGATEAVKQGTTQQIMDDLKKELGSRLKKGYEATYLGNLKQAGVQVNLWKLTFKDGGDDVLIRQAMKEGKVAGFFVQ